MEYFENYQNVTQRHEVSKCPWKNGADRFPCHSFARNPQFVKYAVSVKHNKMKYHKMRYAWTPIYITGQAVSFHKGRRNKMLGVSRKERRH